jgi:hypothetical protein
MRELMQITKNLSRKSVAKKKQVFEGEIGRATGWNNLLCALLSYYYSFFIGKFQCCSGTTLARAERLL